MHSIKLSFSLVLFLMVQIGVNGQSSPANIASTSLNIVNAYPNLTFFNQPLLFTHAGDGTNRVFVVEKTGSVLVFDNDSDVMSRDVFLDISDKILPPGHPDVGETGLLSLTFHPQYASNGRLYISYVDENLVSIVSELQVSEDPQQADMASERVLLSMQQPQRNHNGGHIAFGPDGFLYIAFGDGFSESSRDGIDSGDPLGHGQNLETWFSSVLRIDVDRQTEEQAYVVPSDNPFVGNQEGWKEEIYAYGFRNPWRFSFDRQEGTLWLADVGDKKAEEIDIVTSGRNYGWNLKEASHCFEDVPCDTTRWVDLTDPIYEYLRDVGESVTGGYVYRGSKQPNLQGKYVYGDFDFGTVWALDVQDGDVVSNEELVANAGQITSFGEDESGEIYIVDFRGRIWTFEEPATTSLESPDSVPQSFALLEVYPNPFSRETQIAFEVSAPADLVLRVFDVTGRTVRTLANQRYVPGQYTLRWNGEDDSGHEVASGTYVYILEGDGFRESKAVVLLR